MPFIAVSGPSMAGKNTVIDYLVTKYGYTRISLNDVPAAGGTNALLAHVTKQWTKKWVFHGRLDAETLELFCKRPFFLHIAVDAPVILRFKRQHLATEMFETFVGHSDAEWYYLGMAHLMSLATIRILNDYKRIEDLHDVLDRIDLDDPTRFRPSWDVYFMQLADLAAKRSNCMKRRVGCVLTRDNRIIATGYNGTPRGVKNCNQGGCERCNKGEESGQSLSTCLCMHAEENAMLEAGRERVATNSVLYCNTCPCLTCSIKIVQVGVKEVVYNESYKMDTASFGVLKEGGVILRQFSPPLYTNY